LHVACSAIFGILLPGVFEQIKQLGKLNPGLEKLTRLNILVGALHLLKTNNFERYPLEII
jgi:hypothetical protein